MILVDTSAWIDYFRGLSNGQTKWLNENLGRIAVGMTDLSFCELLQGERSLPELESLRIYLLRFPILETGGVELATASARNYLVLRQRGITIRSTVDCLIATFAIEGGFTLLHHDRDFDAFEQHLGLRVVKL